MCVYIYFPPSNVHAAHITGVPTCRSVQLSFPAAPRCEILLVFFPDKIWM